MNHQFFFKWVMLMMSFSIQLLAGAEQFSKFPEYQKGIARSLKQAGSNRAELIKALRHAPAEQTKGMQFLIAYMPEHDCKLLKAEFLLSNVAWAYKARNTYSWAKKVPEDIFLNDILPYAALNERRDNWREDFYKRFSKHVINAKTQIEAIKAVNNAILREVKVKYSTKRKKPDQSPYESMEQGLASCTGLSILLNSAFRAVGIPSRVVGIPMWTTKRGNHNWVEVWTTGQKRWQFTEYYPDKNGLDHGWLLGDAAKANEDSYYHSIYSSSWKSTGRHFPLVWDMHRKDVPAVNVTRRYVMLGGGIGVENACELRIQYLIDNKRMVVPVAVYQGDVKLREGESPMPTDDVNRYFSVRVKMGQIYQIVWKDPKTGKAQRLQVTTPKDKAWLVVTLE